MFQVPEKIFFHIARTEKEFVKFEELNRDLGDAFVALLQRFKTKLPSAGKSKPVMVRMIFLTRLLMLLAMRLTLEFKFDSRTQTSNLFCAILDLVATITHDTNLDTNPPGKISRKSPPPGSITTGS